MSDEKDHDASSKAKASRSEKAVVQHAAPEKHTGAHDAHHEHKAADHHDHHDHHTATTVHAAAHTATHTTTETAAKAVKLASEVFVTPGASLLVDGNIAAGGAHVILGFAARAVFGVPGLLLIAANSYSKSVSNKNLLQHVKCFMSN